MTLKFKNEIVHQQKGDFSEVRNLKLFGSNQEIGFKLGEIAKNDQHISRTQYTDLVKHQTQIKYLKENYSIHYQRMKGLAQAYTENLTNSKYDFTCFGNPLGINACSAVYYPPEITKLGTGVLSRNLDLPLLSFLEMMNGEKDNSIPAVSNIYIVEMYPDKGYSSMVNLSFELYGLGLDGINSEGLTVTHLYADSINSESYKPTNEYAVGINEMLVVQLILDNCKTVQEAKEILLRNKHFYMLLPTHLLVADRYGDSFIWEYSQQHNQEFIIDRNSKAQIVTNFLVHEFPEPECFPKSEDKACPFDRFRVLRESLEGSELFTVNEIKAINAQVFMKDDMYTTIPQNKVRTIYHNIYDTHKKSMEISFYRKDVGNQEQLRTEYFEFVLRG